MKKIVLSSVAVLTAVTIFSPVSDAKERQAPSAVVQNVEPTYETESVDYNGTTYTFSERTVNDVVEVIVNDGEKTDKIQYDQNNGKLEVNGEVVNYEETSSPIEQLANKNDTSAGILRDQWSGYNVSKGTYSTISASVAVLAGVLLATSMTTAKKAAAVTAAAGVIAAVSSVKTTVHWSRLDYKLMNAKKGQYERKSDIFFKNYKNNHLFSSSWLWKRKLK
ncbi:hypothetical protein [Bacillus siamensis]|uniref:hypothetical protein n=1 Tax=Bacillus siamensis TaxID=659243 RepID=UPI0022B78B66|nr:hypothetical protein [Bacillus siamensis]